MRETRQDIAAAIVALFLLATRQVSAQETHPPALRIGILGSPIHRVAWTDTSVEALKAFGFNEVQINIAWGSRPFGEALNLVDVVTVPGEAELPGTAERRAELQKRMAMAHQHGLHVMFQFGSPRADYNPYSGVDAAGGAASGSYRVDVRDHEVALLREFRHQFPEVEDILVYTYDQHAWQTPEFQYTRDAYGLPLADRLPAYLAALHDTWTAGRAGQVRMWWEPWELSAGQVYATLLRLPRADFGLIVHANIAEAQLAMPVDVWVRNTARMAQERGIPVVAESFFASATEEIEPLSIPAPKLVDQSYLAFMSVSGIVGIKEYYGINTDTRDIDLDLLKARLRQPQSSTTEDLLAHVTARYGAAQKDVRAYLDLLSNALATYPWDASWFGREVGRASTDHGWSAATLHGASWSTPSWQATRRAKFMQTGNSQPHFWMLEDVQLRCALAADLLDQASDLAERLVHEMTDVRDAEQFRQIQSDVDVFRHVSRSYALHLRETNVAQLLRQDLEAGRPMSPALTTELRQLLAADVTNQGGQGRVVEMRRLYNEDEEAFVRRYLIPSDGTAAEKGDFSLTTR